MRAHPDDAGRSSDSGGASGDDEAPTVLIEEIFLEGDSTTILRHEAGSARAMGLIEFAELGGFAAEPPDSNG